MKISLTQVCKRNQIEISFIWNHVLISCNIFNKIDVGLNVNLYVHEFASCSLHSAGSSWIIFDQLATEICNNSPSNFSMPVCSHLTASERLNLFYNLETGDFTGTCHFFNRTTITDTLYEEKITRVSVSISILTC